MARTMVILTILLLSAGGTQGSISKVSPVQKVIQLLEEYKAKVVADLAAEEKEMAAYADFCDSESSEKGYEIKTAGQRIAVLTAQIEDSEAQIASYESEVTALGTESADKQSELDAASGVRVTEKAAFTKNEGELLDSIDGLERAGMEIKKSSADSDVGLLQVKSGKHEAAPKPSLKSVLSALSQIVDASWINDGDRKRVQGLMQLGANADEGEEEDLQLRAPKAAAYESATTGVLKTIEEMKDKAESALADARNTEMNQQHSHEMMAQSLTDGLEATKTKLAEAKGQIAAKSEASGEDKAELTETEKSKKSSEDYLKSLTVDCNDAKQSWAKRQEEAAAEQAALTKAKEILAERVRVFVQVGGRTKGAGRADGDSDEDAAPAETRVREAVLAKLRTLSHKYNSYALMEMVTAAAADPFEKIRGLIENMIAKLTNEANQEATQKAFCDEEIAKSKASQADKNLGLDKLKSRLDTADSKKATLLNSVKELQGEIADLDKATSEATKIREEEKATHAQAAKDYKDAADAVEQAITVLKEYYEGVSLSQVAGGSRQPTFGGKKGDAASTILSILEMCGEDFTKTYMELTQQEAIAQEQYEKLMQESSVAKAAKAAEVKGAESEIKSLDVALKNNKEDYDTTSQELDAVLAYLDKLKPQCESQAMSYQEKKSRREAELAGLKEALSILEGSAPAALAQMRAVRYFRSAAPRK